MKPHQLLAASGELLQRLAAIAANEAKPLVKAHGAAIPAKHPQEDGPDPGELQTIENLVDHAEGKPLTPKFWSNPSGFQETLMGRSAGLTRDTSDANLFVNCFHPDHADVPVTSGRLRAPLGLVISAFLFIG